MKTRLCFSLLLSLVATLSAGAADPTSAPTPIPTLESSTTPTFPSEWMRIHDWNVADAKARADKIQIVLLGDSITVRWTAGAGLPLFTERYAPHGAINLGISGDGTQNVLWRLQHGVLDPLHPKMVLLLIGTNNLMEEPDAVAYGVWTVVTQIRKTHPETRLLVEAIFPRQVPGAAKNTGPAKYPDKIPLVNALLAKLDDGKMVKFLDFSKSFLKPDGSFNFDNFPDGTHPEKPEAFQIWADAVQPTVDAWLKEPPVPNVPPPPSPVPVPKDLVSSTPMDRNDWLAQFQGRCKRAEIAKGNCDVVFIGTSTMSLWDRMKPTFEKEFAADKAVNLAVPGSRTENILWQVENGGLDNVQPKVVVVQVQENVLDRTPAENVAAGMKAIAHAVAQKTAAREDSFARRVSRRRHAGRPDAQKNRGIQ